MKNNELETIKSLAAELAENCQVEVTKNEAAILKDTTYEEILEILTEDYDVCMDYDYYDSYEDNAQTIFRAIAQALTVDSAPLALLNIHAEGNTPAKVAENWAEKIESHTNRRGEAYYSRPTWEDREYSYTREFDDTWDQETHDFYFKY